MRYQRPLLAGVAGLVLAAGLTAATPAQAKPEPAPFGLYAPTALVLSLGYGENTDTVQRAVTLTCAPDGGDHPNVTDACDALDDVDGSFRALSGEDGVCTREYRPVTITASGVWRGQHTRYRATFSNRCMMIRAKGPVFEF